jgi:hypothetical protein
MNKVLNNRIFGDAPGVIDPAPALAFSDREELREWQEEQSHIDHDADFGASMFEPDREEMVRWDLERSMAPMLSRWTNTQLLHLVGLAEWTGTRALGAAASTELARRLANRKRA